MRTEIGSEFWNVPSTPITNSIFPNGTNWFISGRSALRAIIAENSFKTVAIPDWCCDSMIVPFADCGIAVRFYDALNPPDVFYTDAVLIMDFFGYATDYSPVNYDGAVIRDLTHSLFSKKYDDADYYFGSLRKWAGFYTGGFAWGFKKEVIYTATESKYVALRKTAMAQKEVYLTGKSESKDYLKVFAEAEGVLDTVGIEKGCATDAEKAFHLDVDFIKSTRRRNAQMLLSEFSDIAIYPQMKPDDCPLFVPIRVKNRDELRMWLIQNEIYCPVHWPISEYHKISENARHLYDEELSLICDQRYNENDMQRMIDAIKRFNGR